MSRTSKVGNGRLGNAAAKSTPPRSRGSNVSATKTMPGKAPRTSGTVVGMPGSKRPSPTRAV